MENQTEKLKIAFIVNPFSGMGKHLGIEQAILKYLDRKKFDYRISFTERPHHAKELSEQAISDNCDVIVAVGGDGTVNEVAQPIVGTNRMLGIIPSGSGNGLARHLNIPIDSEKAIRLLNGLNSKSIDAVEVNNQFFVSIAGVGFDARVAKKYAGQKQRGFLKYFQIVFLEYFRYRPRKFTMTVNGKKITRKALFISFANSDQFGYNTTIAPGAKIDDGLIDICIMKKVPLWKIMLVVPLLFTKKINRSPYMEIIRANIVDIRQKKKTINLDGEPIKMSKHLHIEVKPQSLKVLVPAKI